MSNLLQVLANASVAKKQIRQLADSISDNLLNHDALVAYYALVNLEDELKKLESPTHDNQLLTNELNQVKKELLSSQLEVSTLNGCQKELLSKISFLDEQYVALNQEHTKIRLEFSSKLEEVKRLNVTIDKLNSQLLASKNKEAEVSTKLHLAKESMLVEIETAKEKSVKRLEIEQKKVQKLNEKLHKAEAEIAELSRDLTKMNGASALKPFAGKSKGVQFFIHEYKSPMSIRFDTQTRTRQLMNVNWHFQVMRNNGVSINVGASSWLVPILPECEDMRSEWNPEISLALHDLMMINAKETHPLEYSRVIKAKKLAITTNTIFTPDEKRFLQKSKIITLFDAISLTYTAFLSHMQKNNKKLNDEECLIIRSKIEEIAEQFSLESTAD